MVLAQSEDVAYDHSVDVPPEPSPTFKRVQLMTPTSGFQDSSEQSLSSLSSSTLFARRLSYGAIQVAPIPEDATWSPGSESEEAPNSSSSNDSTSTTSSFQANPQIFRRPKAKSISASVLTLPPASASPVKIVTKTVNGDEQEQSPVPIPPFDPDAGWLELSMIPESPDYGFYEDALHQPDSASVYEESDVDDIFTPDTDQTGSNTPLTSAPPPVSQKYGEIPKLMIDTSESPVNNGLFPPTPLSAPMSAVSPLFPQRIQYRPRSASLKASLHSRRDFSKRSFGSKRAFVPAPLPLTPFEVKVEHLGFAVQESPQCHSYFSDDEPEEDDDDDEAYMSDPGTASTMDYGSPIPSKFSVVPIERGRQNPFPVQSIIERGRQNPFPIRPVLKQSLNLAHQNSTELLRRRYEGLLVLDV